MKRSRVNLEAVADWHNLAAAFGRAARASRRNPEVETFRANLEAELAQMRSEILDGNIALGRTTRFRIRDPKPRIIHAPCLNERVLHHALMAHAGPVLDRSLVADTYACRLGKGTSAAVRRCQQHVRRFPWYAQIDIRAYFANIDQTVLLDLLARRFKDRGLLDLMTRIVMAHRTSPGRGLPIGALTSQHFANFYLSGLDRFLLETCRVRGLIRYMDDLVWWCDDRAAARATLQAADGYVRDHLRLEIKQPVRVGRSADGVMLCGYRVLPGALRLSRRRRRRYAARRKYWEDAYARGEIDARTLQAGFSAVLAITVHADAAAWRREQLRRRPLEETLAAL